MAEFNAGETVRYFEEGAEWEVEILEDMSTADRQAFRLRVLKIITAHPMAVGKEPGDEFECSQPSSMVIFTLQKINIVP